jgi:hypothetical protein
MHHAELTESVRQLIADAFLQWGLTGGDAPRESLLIRDGAYCGRRFDAQGGHALWFFEEDQVKLFGADGGVLRVIQNVSNLRSPMRAAA